MGAGARIRIRATVTVTVSQSAVAAGAELTVSWSVPAGQSDADWIGLFRVGDPNTKVIWFDYTNTSTGTSVTRTAWGRSTTSP